MTSGKKEIFRAFFVKKRKFIIKNDVKIKSTKQKNFKIFECTIFLKN